MSFSRVKPDNWAVNEKLTSAQQNQLDIDHAKAVDKTGDTITGNVHIGSGAFLTVDSGGQVKVVSGGQIRVESGGAYNAQSGSNTNFLSGSAATFNAGATLAMSGTMAFFSGDLSFDASSSFAAACVSQFAGNVEFNGSGVLGSMLVKVQTGADVRVKTGSRIYIENGGTAYFDTSATVEMLADIAFGTGHTSSYPNGSQIFFQGASTHTLTSTVTHASGSSETYASGASLTQSAGASWSLAGATTAASGSTITHASGSTETWSAGAVATFTAVPTFTNGLSATGGTTTFSSTVHMSGTTTITGGTNRLKLTSRLVQRRVNLADVRFGLMYFGGGIGQSPLYNASDDLILMKLETPGSASQGVSLPLDIPNNATLTRVEVDIDALSDADISLALRRNATTFASIAAPAPTGVNVLTVSELINRAASSYRLVISAESSGGFKIASINSVVMFYAVDEYDEG